MVTLIVPVYNGEKHIGKCIDEILKQTYENIEVIVINDGSTDKTREIIEEKEKNDDRVKIINQNNQGVSCSRNNGIKIANGEYILFLDSDDFYKYDAVEKLIEHVDMEDKDLVLYGYCVQGVYNRKNDTNILKIVGSQKEDVLKRILSTENNIFGYTWRAMYRKDFLLENEIYFPTNIKISEDFMFLINAVNSSNKIEVDAEEYYIYNITESSMTTKYIPSLYKDMTKVNEWIFNNVVKNNKELYDGFYCCELNTYLRNVQNEIRSKEKTNTILKKIMNIKKNDKIMQNINIVKNLNKKFDKKSYLGILLFKFNLEYIYILLFKFKYGMKGVIRKCKE